MSVRTNDPNGGAGASHQHIDQVGMIVRDADEACRTFVKDFGLTVAVDWVEPGGGFRLVYLDSGGTTRSWVSP